MSFAGLLACPSCGGALVGLGCACGARYRIEDGVVGLRLPGAGDADQIVDFYTAAPFPGYPPRMSLALLRQRAARSEFARLLDQAIAPDARIVEIGCGTGQMSLYLATADRLVVAADLTRAALVLGAAAARQLGLDERVLFVETDLHQPGLREGAFDVVYSSGVLHHTPDPRAAFAKVARLARPGGLVIVGLYNVFARLPLRLRRMVARVTNYRLIPFDPVLRDRAQEPARREAWFRDQYLHPEEHRHTLGQVQRWFAENRVEYLRAYPNAMIGAAPLDGDELAQPASDNWGFENLLAQLHWAASLGREGGLFVTVGRRLPAAG